MDGYVPGEQPQESGFVKLNTNENPYPPSPKVAAVLRGFDAARLRLYPDPVCMRLRRRIAEIHSCKASQVFVGNGSDEVLALCSRAFVEKNGSIGFFNPSYLLYPVLADILDVRKKTVELGKDFEWRMARDYKSSLFFLCYPNAPTGTVYPRRQIEDFCLRFPGVVVIDEAYVDFSRENCMDLALRMDNVLVARSLSKSFSLAGVRVGYIVGPENLVKALFKLKDSYNLDAVSQAIALAALSDLGHMRRNVTKIKTTRRKAADALRKMGFTVYPSESNFLWVKPRKIMARQLFESLRKQRILVRYFAGRRTGNFLRITIGTDGEVSRLLETINSLTMV